MDHSETDEFIFPLQRYLLTLYDTVVFFSVSLGTGPCVCKGLGFRLNAIVDSLVFNLLCCDLSTLRVWSKSKTRFVASLTLYNFETLRNRLSFFIVPGTTCLLFCLVSPLLTFTARTWTDSHLNSHGAIFPSARLRALLNLGSRTVTIQFPEITFSILRPQHLVRALSTTYNV